MVRYRNRTADSSRARDPILLTDQVDVCGVEHAVEAGPELVDVVGDAVRAGVVSDANRQVRTHMVFNTSWALNLSSSTSSMKYPPCGPTRFR